MSKFLKLKYFIVSAFLALALLNSCNNKNSVIIRLTVTSSTESEVYLEKLSFSSSSIIDSAEISKGSNNIRFRVKSIVEPTFFVLRVKGSDGITLLSEPGEKMDIVLNTDKIYDYQVLGSKGSLKTKELAAKLSGTKGKLYDLKAKYNITKEPGARSSIEQEFNALIDSQRAYNTKFIWANAMSRVSVMAVYQKFDDNAYVLDRAEDLVLFKTVASALRAIYPNSEYTAGMLTEIKKIEGIINANKLKNIVNQSITSIPEIELPNPQGDIIKLSSLKGKVVLLGFWASWDQNSLMDNRELLSIYKKFKGKGFEIYQVSVESNREDWVNAIESADLPWINVCELNPKGSMDAKVYNVNQLPMNYLIDKNQTIIGKNLFGEALIKKLQEVL